MFAVTSSNFHPSFPIFRKGLVSGSFGLISVSSRAVPPLFLKILDVDNLLDRLSDVAFPPLLILFFLVRAACCVPQHFLSASSHPTTFFPPFFSLFWFLLVMRVKILRFPQGPLIGSYRDRWPVDRLTVRSVIVFFFLILQTMISFFYEVFRAL